MSILQQIINPNNDSMNNISEQVSDLDFLDYPCLNPTIDSFVNHVPQNCSGWSFLDVSLNIYNHYLSVKRVAKEIGGFFADMFYYQSNVKSIAKAEKLRKKKFVSQQVRAMRLAFVRFNTSCECMEDSKGVVCYTNRPFSSIWEERSSSLGMYRVRNKHCSYTNRRIARHWTDGKFSIVK